MTDPTDTNRRLSDRQTAGVLILVAAVVAVAPIATGLSTMAILGGGLLAFLIVVAALGIASGRAEYGEPPRRTG
jgi:hypothetical protein